MCGPALLELQPVRNAVALSLMAIMASAQSITGTVLPTPYGILVHAGSGPDPTVCYFTLSTYGPLDSLHYVCSTGTRDQAIGDTPAGSRQDLWSYSGPVDRVTWQTTPTGWTITANGASVTGLFHALPPPPGGIALLGTLVAGVCREHGTGFTVQGTVFASNEIQGSCVLQP